VNGRIKKGEIDECDDDDDMEFNCAAGRYRRTSRRLLHIAWSIGSGTKMAGAWRGLPCWPYSPYGVREYLSRWMNENVCMDLNT